MADVGEAPFPHAMYGSYGFAEGPQPRPWTRLTPNTQPEWLAPLLPAVLLRDPEPLSYDGGLVYVHTEDLGPIPLSIGLLLWPTPTDDPSVIIWVILQAGNPGLVADDTVFTAIYEWSGYWPICPRNLVVDLVLVEGDPLLGLPDFFSLWWIAHGINPVAKQPNLQTPECFRS